MPVPTLLTDLSATIASNSPAGSDNVFPDLDNYLRALSGFLASIRDNSGNGWVSPYLPLAGGTVTGPATFSSTLALNGALSGTGLTTYLASPPAIGGTAAAAVSSTNLSYTGTLTGGTGVVALGTNQFYKDASGNVGIGTASPAYKLDVVGDMALKSNATYLRGTTSGGASVRLLGINGANTAYVGPIDTGPIDMLLNAASSSTNMQFYASGTEQMRLTSTGLGIGTAAPNSKLVVNGGIRAVGGSAFDGTNGYSFAGSGDADGGMFSPADGVLVWATNNIERMRLDASGNLGIGTSSPGAKLDVVGAGVFRLDGSGSTTPLILRNNNTASTQLVKLGFDSSGAIKASINAAVYGNDYMTFNVGSDTERMRLDSSGNLGLGTTAPQSKMEIRQTTGGSVVNALTLSNYVGASVGTGVALHFDPNGAGSLARTASIQSVQATSGNYADLRFFVSNSTTPAEAARITSAGDMRVGSGAPLAKLDVAGGIAPTAAPSANWGLDFAPSTSSGTYTAIANNGTYDLATGSGMLFLFDEAGTGFGQLACYYGQVAIVWQSTALYTNTVGTASKVNVFYNAGTGKYRIENKVGAAINLWVSTMRMRNAS